MILLKAQELFWVTPIKLRPEWDLWILQTKLHDKFAVSQNFLNLGSKNHKLCIEARILGHFWLCFNTTNLWCQIIVTSLWDFYFIFLINKMQKYVALHCLDVKCFCDIQRYEDLKSVNVQSLKTTVFLFRDIKKHSDSCGFLIYLFMYIYWKKMLKIHKCITW